MNRKDLRVIVLIMCAGMFWSFSQLIRAEELTMASAINKAGLQRMLVQRIGKAYCQLGLGIEPESSATQLVESVNLFDTQLAELEAFSKNKDIVDALSQARTLWDDIKRVATGPVNREGAKRVAYWSDDLLFAANKVVQLLQDDANTSYARLVNISGRQRMLSQRLAKFYMLRIWGFDTMTVRDGLEATSNEFTGALTVLQNAPENTEDIREELASVAADWDWIVKAIEMVDTDPFPKTVANVSESILVKMDRITKLYQDLADKLTSPRPVQGNPGVMREFRK